MVRFPSSGDSVEKKRRQVPRNYFSRREQIRLLFLVALLGAVILLMVEAAQPSNWQWLWRGQSSNANVPVDASPDATRQAVDTRLPRKADSNALEDRKSVV